MAKRMNTANVLLSSLALAGASLITSCEDFDNGFDEATIRYNQNFIERFGHIDPNQDWNLVRQLAMNNGGGKYTRENVANKNEWNNDFVVPGYPDALGTYHIRRNDGTRLYINDASQLTDQDLPAGDVTDEEILWVSEWFRNNRDPESDAVYWKDYFLQEISKDCDRTVDEKTQSCNRGTPITDGPIYSEYDYTYSEDFPDPNASKIKDWTQSGTRVIDYGVEELCILMNPDNKKTWDPTMTLGEEQWEHVNNFNSGVDTNYFGKKSEDGEGFAYEYVVDENGNNLIQPEDLDARTIMLFKGSGTADFAYHNSNASKYFHKYVLKHLVFDISQTDPVCKIHQRACVNHHYDGYYLGFDYEVYTYGAEKAEDGKLWYKPRDGFYSNYILKISKGVDEDGNSPSEYPKNKIMEQGLLVCEDLGDYDYDFNDVVLKLQHIQTVESEETKDQPKDRLRITAMAAGGTLESRVYYLEGGKDANAQEVMSDEISEIHEMLNGKAPKIINAGPQFIAEGKTWTSGYIDLNALGLTDDEREAFASYVFDHGWIKIVVDDGKNTEIRPIRSGVHTDEANGFKRDEAPQMMFLPIDFLWPQEEHPIDQAYTKFKDWVQDESKKDWYKTPEADQITWRYVTSASDGDKTTPQLSATDVNNNNNPVNPGQNMELMVGSTLVVKCSSTNTNRIRCTVSPSDVVEYTWSNNTLTMNVKPVAEPPNEDVIVTVTFIQTGGGTTATLSFYIKMRYS